MPPEFINWLMDVGQYLHIGLERRHLRRQGRGMDYTRVEYRDVAQRVVAPLHPKRMKLRLKEIAVETASTKTLRFERTDGALPPFRAGQYVNLYVEIDGVRTSRPFSISSAPGGETLDVTVRAKPGGFVAPFLLDELQAGDELESSGPAGNFYYEPLIDGKDLVFLAGGSGITPFMSILRSLLRSPEGGDLRIRLLYGSRTEEDVIFKDELARMAAAHPNFSYELVISEPGPATRRPTGFLDAGMIRSLAGDASGKTFYVCGPELMYELCLRSLRELGAPEHRIRHELFGLPGDVTRLPGWPEGLSREAIFQVEVVGSKTIHAPAGEPLMNSLERHGIVVPAQCRAGVCSLCRTQLLSGRVFAPPQASVRESDRQHGYIHPCASYPVEDLRIRI
jgi:ferredoxin-NADP reductase